MKKTYSAGGVIIQNKTRKILVVEQRNGSWSLPKGHIDPGENALEAAKREVKEESGIRELKLIKKLGSYDRFKIFN